MSGRNGPVPIQGTKRRALLTALLSGANRVVTVDELTEWLWPGKTPSSATQVIQAHVSVLRRQLEPDRPPRSPPRMLLTQPPGYLMRIKTDQLDSLRFALLVQSGTQAMQQKDIVTAVELLQEALSLWQGEALCGVRHLPAAQSEIARLEELRLTATGLYMDACLNMGQYDEAIPQLSRLVVLYPYHERFYAQLMVALARSGRRAEALSVYRKAHSVLTNDLAVSPGSELRRLEAAILADELELGF
ncbi:MAG TPA: AfsR/SARP family transcriptional regulator [Candidatus Limnocylindrales bacterium]|nr:AfsR/SARP family transcriptional regulator [Candidatus Limnocylindrales bacterium]